MRLLPLDLPHLTWYLPVRTILWGIMGAAAGAGLFFGRSWSLRFTRWATVAYFLWYCADRLLLRSSTFARQALLFYGMLLFLACSLILWVLSRESTWTYLEE